MRRYTVPNPEMDYFELLDLVETAYEQGSSLEFSARREELDEVLVLEPNLIERRRYLGTKILEFLGVEVETQHPFLARATFPGETLEEPQDLEVIISDRGETLQPDHRHSSTTQA